ncbi:MAG: type II secretion system protein GspD [Pyramidobacter sp.]
MILEGVSFPAVKYERDFETPLASHATVEQSDRGTLIVLSCEAPLRIDGVRGAGTKRMQVRLKRTDRAVRHGGTLELKSAEERNVLPAQKIDLSLKDCDLHDIFRMLGALAGVNIVVDGSVPQSARMTLSFENAPFDEVFRYVIQSQNLQWHSIGKTLVVGAKGASAMLTGRLITKSYRVDYGDTGKIAPLLKEMAELFSPADRILVDERQNLLIVTATAFQHERVRAALGVLDAPQRQVMLKARIIEVNDEGSNELETAINAVYDWWWASYQGGELSAGVAYSSPQNSDRQGLPGLEGAGKLPGTIGKGVVDLAGRAAKMLDFRLNALVEEKKARVLADPTVTVLDGEKATVKLVDKLKYVSRRDDANNPSYGDEEVGPTLEVLPRIGRNGMITVNVALATGEVIQWIRGSRGEQIPQVNSRSVTTRVSVRDGEPFVIGGLFKDSKSRIRAGVPVLQNLPLLGWLFRYRTTKTLRSQVVMVVIPAVLEIPDGTAQ